MPQKVIKFLCDDCQAVFETEGMARQCEFIHAFPELHKEGKYGLEWNQYGESKGAYPERIYVGLPNGLTIVYQFEKMQ